MCRYAFYTYVYNIIIITLYVYIFNLSIKLARSICYGGTWIGVLQTNVVLKPVSLVVLFFASTMLIEMDTSPKMTSAYV